MPVGSPFTVLATQNPIEYDGTYPLPEAQLDRFLLRVRVGYPDADDELEMLRRRVHRKMDDVSVEAVLSRAQLIALQDAVELVHIDDTVAAYAVAIVHASRSHADLLVGASPRGSLAIVKLARGRALMQGRNYVVPDDVKAVAVPALAHRVVLRPEVWIREVSAEAIISDVLTRVPAPSWKS